MHVSVVNKWNNRSFRDDTYLNTTPSTLCSAASFTSSTDCNPFSTNLPAQAFLAQTRSSQLKPLSIYVAKVLVSPLPFSSLEDEVPLIGVLIEVSALTLSSASLLPGTGASTVRNSTLTPKSQTLFKSSSEDSLFLFTYNWKKNGWSRASEMMSSTGYEALMEAFAHWLEPHNHFQ